MTVVINEVNLEAFLHDPAGGIAQFMGNVIVPDILAQARDYCSRPFPGHGPRGTRFPPPGPPYLRTGDFVAGLEVQTIAVPSGVEYDIVPTATHRGTNYGLILKARGYRFLPDSYYV